MTLNELSTLCLQTLGIVAVGRTPSAKDGAFAEGVLTRALAQLATPSHDIALWAIDDTPDAYADAFIQFASPMFVRNYGIGATEADRLMGLRRLRELTADVRSSAPGTAEYF